MPPTKPLTLRHNFFWTFIGNAVYAGCQGGMLMVLAKLGSPEMVGKFTLGLAVTAPIIMFTNLQLRTVQATDTKRQYLFSDYLGLRLCGTGLAMLIIAAIIAISGYGWETSLVILVMGLAKAFESISDVFYGLIQQNEQMDRIAISLMIKGPLSLLLLGLGIYLSGSVIWGVVGLAVAWAIVLVGYDFHSGALMLNQVAKLQPRWQPKKLVNLLWLSLPLGFVMMLISLNTNIPRYFIERYLGERELGIFAALAYLIVAGNIVVDALGQSASHRLAKYYATGNNIAFRILLLKLVGIGALLGGIGVLVSVVAGPQILTLLYRPEYAQRADLFVWLMIVAVISYVSSFLGYGMTSARYFFIQMPLFTIVTSISAIACFWLIPSMGLLGVVIA
uniref:lipopolysaccharide biosynthesis protein n=1 Tax=Aetokthonos hydrillicola TaxID=1550245 RepID=UPI001ABB5751